MLRAASYTTAAGRRQLGRKAHRSFSSRSPPPKAYVVATDGHTWGERDSATAAATSTATPTASATAATVASSANRAAYHIRASADQPPHDTGGRHSAGPAALRRETPQQYPLTPLRPTSAGSKVTPQESDAHSEQLAWPSTAATASASAAASGWDVDQAPKQPPSGAPQGAPLQDWGPLFGSDSGDGALGGASAWQTTEASDFGWGDAGDSWGGATSQPQSPASSSSSSSSSDFSDMLSGGWDSTGTGGDAQASSAVEDDWCNDIDVASVAAAAAAGAEGGAGMAPDFDLPLHERLTQEHESYQWTRPDLWQRQVDLEEKAQTRSLDRFRTLREVVVQMGNAGDLGFAANVMRRWFRPLATAIDTEQRRLWDIKMKHDGDIKTKKKARVHSVPWSEENDGGAASSVDGEAATAQPKVDDGDQVALAQLLLSLEPEKLAVITMHAVLDLVMQSGTGEAPIVAAVTNIGKHAHAEVNLTRLRSTRSSVWHAVQSGLRKADSKRNMQLAASFAGGEWSVKAQVLLGAKLLDLLLTTATVQVPLQLVEHAPTTAAAAAATAATATGAGAPGDAAATQQQQQASDDSSKPLTGWDGFAARLLQTAAVESQVEAFLQEASTAADEGAEPLVSVPAFRHFKRRIRTGRGVKHRGMLAAHALIPKLFEAYKPALMQQATYYPMLVPPRPWSRHNNSVYLEQQAQLIRTRNRTQMAAIRMANMDTVYDALNALGAVPWRLNNFVFDVVKESWATGGDIGDIPPTASVELPRPEQFGLTQADVAVLAGHASRSDQAAAAVRGPQYAKARRQYIAALERARRTNANRHSLRCDFEIKLGIADELQQDTFYFPFNLDFRGRAYPVPPNLNHMGSDVCRALLRFEKAEALGSTGLKWMKVHLANLMGNDKASFAEREAFIDEHMAEVRDSAVNHLNGNGWWRDADSPWQALSTARELIDAIDSGDPESYRTTLPVHMDGSCNGLQHYAAIGRDAEGAAAVNLTPADRPQDVYSVVLGRVLERIEQDVANSCSLPERFADTLSGLNVRAVEMAVLRTAHDGDEEMQQLAEAEQAALLADEGTPVTADALEAARVVVDDLMATATSQGAAELRKWAEHCECARYLQGRVHRKIVKQTVMTSVYGVTFIGARQQIANRLREEFVHDAISPDEFDRRVYGCSAYLATATLECLGDIFSAADAIKLWLRDCARLVARNGQAMSWITPMGLPVMQPYRSMNSFNVRTMVQNILVAFDDDELPVSIMKQGSAFAPNFVHSLDSTHMLLTALDCTERGLTFAAVHDSYWTHPGRIDEMNASLRQQFIDLYEKPLLEDLRQSLQRRCPEVDFPPLPERGDLDMKLVLESPYFFS